MNNSRFIIVINGATATPKTRDAVTTFLKAKEGWETWHWFTDVWLVHPGDVRPNFNELRDELRKIVQYKGQYMILSAEGRIGASGVTGPDAVPWIQQYWR